MPWLRLLVLAFALAHATGVSELVMRTVCEADCEETDCDGDCAPMCPQCHCAARSVAIRGEADGAAPVWRVARVLAPATSDRVPASPEPGEILHVPIAALG